jgi:DNA-binding HxlR family transcriptional regulator
MSDDECVPFVSDCHVRAAAELVQHVWDPVVLTALRLGPTRRSVLLDRMAGVSDKVLTESLRRLAARGLVERSAGSRQDVAVYALSDVGRSFAEGPLRHLAEWAAENQAELAGPS